MNITKQQMKTPLLTGVSVSEKRDEIKRYFLNTWATYDSLFSLINDESAFYLRPEPLRHPLIFYFGHTATFYINKLILGKYIPQRINEKLEAICAVGVDEMSWDDLNAEHYNWPSVDEVKDYRQQVALNVENLIDIMELNLPISQDSLAWIILMGCEHERIHLETSSVIMRMLPLQYLTPSRDWPQCTFTSKAPINELLAINGKIVELGKPVSAETFGWDNEYGSAQQVVKDFNASKYLVSNAEFLQFVEAGGYQQPELWTDEGQQWLLYSKVNMPRFWLIKNGEYFQRNLLNEIRLPLDWPVEVNYLEAKAFCQWKSLQSAGIIRLPSEAEWFCLRDKLTTDLTEWDEAPGNINLEYFASSCPVNRFEIQGFYDITGNVWQWTESAIDGFTGFEVHPLYDDFSTPTFDGKHNLIKGGSWISTGNEAIKHSRYAFRRHFFQHAGFRYVQTDSTTIPTLAVNQYETNANICQQLECHYGDEHLGIENYPKQVAHALNQVVSQHKISRQSMLDLGCSVGGVTVAMASTFEQVTGIDFSAKYIQYGVQLQQGNNVRYTLKNEGELVDFKEIDGTQLFKGNYGRISFSQGDGVNLKPIFSGYDVVLVQQVLEKSYDPKRLLSTIDQRIKPKGLLVILSDYYFSPDVANKTKWLGGNKVNGENVTGFDGMSVILNDKFTLLSQQEILQTIKESQRNFRLNVNHMTVWQLKD